MRAEIISRETIKPSSPNSQRCYKLSLLDKMSFRIHVPIIFFYLINDHNNYLIDFTYRSSLLKKSLSEALSRYYPLAGRIKDDGNIEFNDEGVDFFEAQVDCDLEGFLKRPELEALNLFVPGGNNQELNSALAVQITFFECGGMAVGASMSHKVGDFSTLITFIKDWAALTRHSGEEVLFPEFINTFLPPNDSLIVREYEVTKGDTVSVTRRFVFSATNLDKLKALATSHGVENPTRVQVAAALIYKCSLSASRLNAGSDQKPSFLLQMVNLRKIVVPPLPEKSFGNMVWYFTVSADTKESKVEFHSLVGQLKEGIARFRLAHRRSTFTGDELSSKICEFMKEADIFHSPVATNHMVTYSCTSWCRFPLYQVDFGWGKPIWVSSSTRWWNTNILMDTRNGDGIEALVTLGEQDMTVFEQDEEFLQFASVNPSALDTN